jgi:hypothetical protein
MGDVAKAVTAPMTGGLSLIPGVGDYAKNFILGKDGQSANLASSDNPALKSLQDRTGGQNSPELQSILQQYSQGGMSLSDALSKAGGIQGGTDRLATDPLTGSLMAAQQVQSNPLTSGLFGKGGIQDQAQGLFGKLDSNLDESRNALMGRDQSYGLQDSDLKAYGQASNNIGRMFAGQEQNLAQSLADRGLGAAPSGAAGQSFSGLYGNKLEQLAGLQQQIAQNRIQTAQGLAQARNQSDLQRQAANNGLIQNLGSQAQNALQDQYGRQVQGSENNYNQLAGTAGLNLNNQALQQNVANSQFSQQQNSKQPGLLDSIRLGAVQGVGGGVSKGLTDAISGQSAKQALSSGAGGIG